MMVFPLPGGKSGRRPLSPAEIAQMDVSPEEIEWAIEEYGWCGTFFDGIPAVVLPNGASWGGNKQIRSYLRRKI